MFIIPDPHCPVIIPFGYACVGKTMLTQRLLRYLLSIGFHVQPELFFRNDTIYPEICSKYMDEIYGNKVAAGTAADGTILLSIIDRKGIRLCYILDISGDYQHKVNYPFLGITPEMNCMLHTQNRKIYFFCIEANCRLDMQERNIYVRSIHNIASVMKKQDKAIFITSKVGSSPFPSCTDCVVDIKSLRQYLEIQYPGLFEPFIKVLPVFSFIKHRKYIIQPFMSGLFCNDTSFKVRYNSGPNMYPEQLWHNIMKCIR